MIIWDQVAVPLAIGVFIFAYVFPCTPLFRVVTTQNFRKQFNIHRRVYYLLATLVCFGFLTFTLHTTRGYDLDYIFLQTVQLLAYVLRKVDDVLQSLVYILLLVMLWKFKDRLLLAVGIDRPGQVLGDFRDWVTCWGMQRFEPVELVFWKIENASVGKHVFLNVSMGYNLDHKTRVKTHHSMRGTGAGVTGTAPGVVSTIPEGINSSATIPPGTTSARGAGTQDQATLGFRLDLRETIQINFDPMEETEVLTIELRQQNIYNSEIISRCQIGGGQLAKMIERERGNAERNPVLNPYLQTSRTGTVSHHTTRLLFDQEQRDEVGSGQLWETLEMVPAGLLYLRCLPVRDQVGEDDV